MTTHELVPAWRERAAYVRRWAADERVAALWELAADELEAAEAEAAEEPLSLSEATAESGYSERRLRELVAEGKIPRGNAPGTRLRIRRGDLPVRRAKRSEPARSTYDADDDARALVSMMR